MNILHGHFAYTRVAYHSPQRDNIMIYICLLFIKCDEAAAACSLCSNFKTGLSMYVQGTDFNAVT